MPTQQGCQLDEEVPETLAGEQSCESRQHRPIRRCERWSVRLASEDRHLVTQDYDLDREVRVSATDEADQLQHAAERPVEQRNERARVPDARRARRQPSKSSSQPMDDILGTHRLAQR
ncbi:MAG: hypothetical protein ACYDEY_07950 [Acidimicrobiales bacterium]